MIRTLLIGDDQPLSANSIMHLARSIDAEIAAEVVDTFAAVVQTISQTTFAALVLCSHLRDSEGLVNLSQVHALSPELPVLVIGESEELGGTARALGASGFVSKRAPLAEVRSALSVVLQGGQWFPAKAIVADARIPEPAQLSPAQWRVMMELSLARPNKLIAHNLKLSVATVKSHLSAIYRALKVSNRAQAIIALRQMGV